MFVRKVRRRVTVISTTSESKVEGITEREGMEKEKRKRRPFQNTHTLQKHQITDLPAEENELTCLRHINASAP